ASGRRGIACQVRRDLDIELFITITDVRGMRDAVYDREVSCKVIHFDLRLIEANEGQQDGRAQRRLSRSADGEEQGSGEYTHGVVTLHPPAFRATPVYHPDCSPPGVPPSLAERRSTRRAGIR